jgi:hypothetical protein
MWRIEGNPWNGYRLCFRAGTRQRSSSGTLPTAISTGFTPGIVNQTVTGGNESGQPPPAARETTRK